MTKTEARRKMRRSRHIRPAKEHWFIAVNGHQAEQRIRKLPEMPPVKPFHAYIEWNGWPAGIITPYGGCIAAGECANEETFIAALKAATARHGSGAGDAHGD